MRYLQTKQRLAFAGVDLLAAIAINSPLMGLLLPAVQNAREEAMEKQLDIACIQTHNTS
jgi:hypothetical protein